MLKGLEIRDRVGGHSDAVVAGRPATITVEFTEVVPMMECQLTIVNSLGQPVTTFDSENSAPADVRDSELGTRIECEVPSLPLLPGRYRIDVVIKGKRQIQDGLQGATFFDVEPGVVGERPMEATSSEGNVVLPHAWRLPA
jgi:lipopolysaccharide transport system ATP-binding protein